MVCADAVCTAATATVPELAHPQAHTAPHPMPQDNLNMKQPQFDLSMQDMAFMTTWDPHAMQTDQMQSFFGLSETELIPPYMNFTDQSTGWFNMNM